MISLSQNKNRNHRIVEYFIGIGKYEKRENIEMEKQKFIWNFENKKGIKKEKMHS